MINIKIQFNSDYKIDILFSASITPAVFGIAASYSDCNKTMAVILLSIAISGQGFDAAGSVSNSFDLSPNYISAINAIAFTISSGAALLGPFVVGLLTPNVNKLSLRNH